MSARVQGESEQISVTFRMSSVSHAALMEEVGHCGCNTSSFIRAAVIKEIQDRRFRRRKEAQNKALPGQTEEGWDDNA